MFSNVVAKRGHWTGMVFQLSYVPAEVVQESVKNGRCENWGRDRQYSTAEEGFCSVQEGIRPKTTLQKMITQLSERSLMLNVYVWLLRLFGWYCGFIV